MRLALIFFFLLNACMLGAQTKYEREYRITAEEVPVAAQDFVASLGFVHKVKWYREEGLHSISVEAKTKHDGACYSIEFSEAGAIEDVEVKVPFLSLPTAVQEGIATRLATLFEKYKIRKTQVQYTGTKEDLSQVLVSEKIDLTVRYELVVKVRHQGVAALKELLFTPEGEVLRQSDIIFRNTDNLEF